jgi:hypothetical protein
VVILVAIVYVALSACVESKPSSPPLPKPTVYEWIGTGPPPSLLRLAQDKSICFQEAELTDPHKDPRVVSEHWRGQLNLCMQKKGWGQKTID